MNPLNSEIMKNRNLIIAAIICFTISVQNFKLNASSFTTINYTSENAINFVENGITFSVFQNGEFDFYLNSITSGLSLNYNSPHVSVSFNTGHNYDAYVQYDQYGAVIQIENTPIYYDQYGRISQVGNLNIMYHSGRLIRVGGLQLHYNSFGHYAFHSGYINHYNRHYVYHPHHNWFIRPYASYSMVRTAPYRHHYRPNRYHYYNDHRYAYKVKKDHRGHHVDKRKMYDKHYNKGNNHKKNYVSHDYRRRENTSYRSNSSSNKKYSSTNKSNNRSYNTVNTSYPVNKRSNGSNNARNKVAIQQTPRTRTTNLKRSPSSNLSSKTRQGSRAPVTRLNEHSRSKKTVAKTSPKRSVSPSSTKRTTGKTSVHKRPKNVHLRTVKQPKTVHKSSQARRRRS